jgi:hypothetical protein
MNAKTIQNLQYFVGKVCSIVSTSMNRAFDEKISREHFVVRIQTLNSDGVWGTHPYNDELVSFFALPHIISIHQEVELDPNNPEHREMIQEFEQRTGQKVETDLMQKPAVAETKELLPVLDKAPSPVIDETTGDATFVDIANLEALAAHSKKSFDAEDSIKRF